MENTPSSGYTTYKLMRDIHVIIDPPELENKYNSGYTNLDLDNPYQDAPDYMHTNYIYLHEGAIFDGCGNSITVDCDYNMVGGVETMSVKNRYNIGQSGLFRVYDFMNETHYNDLQFGPPDLRWETWSLWNTSTEKRNEIKNLGIHGTATGRKGIPGNESSSVWGGSILLQSPVGKTNMWSDGEHSSTDNRPKPIDFGRIGTKDTYIPGGSSNRHKNDPNIPLGDNKWYRWSNTYLAKTNLLIKNIFFTRTRASAWGNVNGNWQNYDSDAIPYIIPGEGMPGPKGHLTVENVYVKLDYSYNSLAGIAGPGIANENVYYVGAGEDYSVIMNGNTDSFRINTCIFKNCIFDYNGHKPGYGDATVDASNNGYSRNLG